MSYWTKGKLKNVMLDKGMLKKCPARQGKSYKMSC